jgi:hypothetical protein
MARDDDAEASERLLRTMDAAAEASTSADRRRVRRAAFVTAACCAAVAAATTYAGANGRWTRGDGAALRAVDEDVTRLSYDPRAMSIGYDEADASSTLGAKNETEDDRPDEALVGAKRRWRQRAWSWEESDGRLLAEWGKGRLHVLRWDPKDGFIFRGHRGDGKFEHAQENLGFGMLRWAAQTYMPTRLAPDQEPFALFFAVEDFPQTRCWKKRDEMTGTLSTPSGCDPDSWSPVFDFSSAPRDEELLPTLKQVTLITLAEPVLAVLAAPPEEAARDSSLPPRWPHQELFGVSGEDASKYTWDKLIPKIVWRGSDYRFLSPEFTNFKEDSCHDEGSCLLNQIAHSPPDVPTAMRAALNRTDITPRLRLVLTSMLEEHWVDARFFCIAKWDSRMPLRARLGKELGIEDNAKMTGAELSSYRYHIDLGGAGGTTWTGTIQKLSMPGVLFHHETDMKDSYFDLIKPWVHYIPVKQDLSDLRQQYQWAEAHPDKCKQISAAASAWVRRFNTRRALLQHNYEKLVKPLAETLDPNRTHVVPFERAHPYWFDARGRPRSARAP